VFAQLSGLDRTGTSLFMSAVIIGGLVLQWPVGKFSDGRDRRQVILGICVATLAICLAMMGKSINNGNALFALGAVYGGLSATLYPLAVAYTNDHLEPEDLVPASGGLVMAYGMGAAIGPLGASGFIQVIGANGLFVFCAIVCVALGGLVMTRMKQRDALAVEDQGDFQAMPRTSPIASEFDPRGETD